MNEPQSGTGRVTPLSDEARETLRALLEMFVPASADGRMPAAGDLPQLVAQIAELAAGVTTLRAALDTLQSEALARPGASFAALDDATRSQVLDTVREREADALRRLALEAVTCYYQQDVVLERLGLEARPPFPKGYQIISGDLSLLTSVKARGRIYREAGD
jgi:hypothetical protein